MDRQDPEKVHTIQWRLRNSRRSLRFRGLGFCKERSCPALDRVVLAEFTAIQRIVALYATTPIATLKAWQAFHLVDATAPYLSRRFVAAHFHFTKALSLESQDSQNGGSAE